MVAYGVVRAVPELRTKQNLPACPYGRGGLHFIARRQLPGFGHQLRSEWAGGPNGTQATELDISGHCFT